MQETSVRSLSQSLLDIWWRWGAGCETQDSEVSGRDQSHRYTFEKHQSGSMVFQSAPVMSSPHEHAYVSNCSPLSSELFHITSEKIYILLFND